MKSSDSGPLGAVPPSPDAAALRSKRPWLAWALVGAGVPAHLLLALGTELSPDEAYYLCAAREPGALPPLVDHPPLLPWLLRLTDAVGLVPVELRVRFWAILLSALTSAGMVALGRRRGASNAASAWVAAVSTFALLPMTGGFVITPDGPLLAALVGVLLILEGPGRWGRTAAAGALLALGALAKVVAFPLAGALALGDRRGSWGARLTLGLLPLVALPWVLPSLGFQLRHAFAKGAGPGGSLADSLGAVLALVGAQAFLWGPPVLWLGLRRLRAAPLTERALVGSLSSLVLLSALVRGVPPEPNWWAPAALVVVLGAAEGLAGLGPKARVAALATVLLPTLVVAAHALHPFLPLRPEQDATARLHGWRSGRGPERAAGVGSYGPAAESCVYLGECEEIRSHFNEMKAVP